MMPLANQLYQMALSAGANNPLASYLVGSAYQESSFKPNELGDFVGGKPTSFGLMQVGSPSLGSGSVQQQFANYMSALQNRAPNTWAAMNAAPTPEAAYAAQHSNPDWRMGIPGGRFDYARQVSGTPSWQMIAGQVGGMGGPSGLTASSVNPSAAVSSLPSSGYAFGTGSNPSQMGTWQDYSNALQKQAQWTGVGNAIGSVFSGLGQQMQQQSQQGMQQAMQMMQRKSPGAAILAQLLNPNPAAYPDYSSYLGG